MNFFSFLQDDEIQYVHQSSLEILEEVVIATASSAPDIVDPVSGITRRSTSDDIARIAHLVNELPGFDVFSISTLADDAPKDQFTLSRFYPALKNCLKPVRTSV